MQRRACITSRMLSSSVDSPRQTLRELARDHEYDKPSPSISGTAHAFTYACASQCAEGALQLLNNDVSNSDLIHARTKQ